MEPLRSVRLSRRVNEVRRNFRCVSIRGRLVRVRREAEQIHPVGGGLHPIKKNNISKIV